MPTENELKFVLKKESETPLAAVAQKVILVRQGYVFAATGVTARVRSSTAKGKKSMTAWQDPEYTFTFKSNCKGRVVELEQEIDSRDFEDLWSKCLNKLEKVRYKYKDSAGQVWDLDFFKTPTDETYFALAELEMPEGQTEPKSIPPWLRSAILYQVPLTDSRYSSKMLADVRYATELYLSHTKGVS